MAARSESPDAVARIHLRKALIRQWMTEFSALSEPITDSLIVPGAGLAPLALDWCAMHDTARAIDIDYENMDRKRQLIDTCGPSSVTSRIACVSCDLRELDATRTALLQHAWNPARGSMWILEGLAYYLSHQELVGLIRLALGGSPRSRIILEFSGPREPLSPRARQQTERYHRIVGASLGGHDLTVTDVDAIARDSCARIDRLLDPAQMEVQLGMPRHFQSSADSSMRIAMLSPNARG